MADIRDPVLQNPNSEKDILMKLQTLLTQLTDAQDVIAKSIKDVENVFIQTRQVALLSLSLNKLQNAITNDVLKPLKNNPSDTTAITTAVNLNQNCKSLKMLNDKLNQFFTGNICDEIEKDAADLRGFTDTTEGNKAKILEECLTLMDKVIEDAKNCVKVLSGNDRIITNCATTLKPINDKVAELIAKKQSATAKSLFAEKAQGNTTSHSGSGTSTDKLSHTVKSTKSQQ